MGEVHSMTSREVDVIVEGDILEGDCGRHSEHCVLSQRIAVAVDGGVLDEREGLVLRVGGEDHESGHIERSVVVDESVSDLEAALHFYADRPACQPSSVLVDVAPLEPQDRGLPDLKDPAYQSRVVVEERVSEAVLERETAPP